MNKLIKNAKIVYYQNKININKNHTKNLWRIVNTVSSLNKEQNICQTLNKLNELVKDEVQRAENFNEYFAEVGQKLADNINKPL